MLTAKRRFEPSVIQRLLDEPYRFQFFQAVRLIELWLKKNGASSDCAVADYVRFKNSISLNFPASEIEALSLHPKTLEVTDLALLEALQKDELDHISLTPAFMGFLGGNGALPNHYTEQIAAHLLYEKDDSPRAFLDTFSNRALTLFYEAWRKYRLEFKFEVEGKDRFLPLLLSLAGTGHSNLQGRLDNDIDGIFDESIGYFSTAVRHRPASASYIRGVVSEYFAVPIQVDQFVGQWYDVPQDQQTALGENNAVLGSVALVGARVWQRDLRLRLTLGPLRKKDFDAFLPGGKSAKSLEKMLTMFTSSYLEYEIQLVLNTKEVSGINLASRRDGGRLGWDTFLLSGAESNNRCDVRYDIHAL
ncbi:type VI secretion system baseplate subunit TssG [Undibacterium sp. Jales W-56]|uniref:type VI secretion system baseplate subunit TssG n=1 Tax=Undibacterium sp. Jales W-56 TaxID=2897325 RepID=UPI0021D3DE0A|nr:type VI secretion system baseplate subunit TssG [Undibacterium sp. Jales W-56]MCU6432932.1 type VI secretion system baseplate subunit TssG [Undibacterium sp. Jales W-56]